MTAESDYDDATFASYELYERWTKGAKAMTIDPKLKQDSAVGSETARTDALKRELIVAANKRISEYLKDTWLESIVAIADKALRELETTERDLSAANERAEQAERQLAESQAECGEIRECAPPANHTGICPSCGMPAGHDVYKCIQDHYEHKLDMVNASQPHRQDLPPDSSVSADSVSAANLEPVVRIGTITHDGKRPQIWFKGKPIFGLDDWDEGETTIMEFCEYLKRLYALPPGRVVVDATDLSAANERAEQLQICCDKLEFRKIELSKAYEKEFQRAEQSEADARELWEALFYVWRIGTLHERHGVLEKHRAKYGSKT